MRYFEAYCPKCGGQLEVVDEERRPQAGRCSECGQGWDVLMLNGMFVSQADKFSKPQIKIAGRK